MARRLPEWLRAWLPVALYLTLIFILSHQRLGRPGFMAFTHADKVAHAVEYAALCALLFRALRHGRRAWLVRWAPLLAIVLASLYGVLDEWHQSFVGRDADVADWLADTLGAGLAMAALLVIAARRPRPLDEAPPD